MYCLFCVVLCIVGVYICTVLLPPGGYPVAVKYIISYHHIISSYHIYHIISSYHITSHHIISYIISYIYIYHISYHISRIIYHIISHIIYHIISSLYFILGHDQITLVLYRTDRNFYKTTCQRQGSDKYKKFATAKVGNFFWFTDRWNSQWGSQGSGTCTAHNKYGHYVEYRWMHGL